ncbi:UNVERIFIED_CONTAM: Protein ROLLING AND ERECT LEAF 2 [Sesamum indicum]
MGCTQSKIENEETVNRCKERKQHMERAVTARNKFAAAHSAHAMSLKNTGAALSDFAQGEVVYPTSSGPGVAPPTSSASVGGATPPPPLPPYENFPPPPPPLPASFTNSSPLQRAATMPEFSIPTPDNKHSDPIIEEENEEDVETESTHSLKRRSKSGGRGGIPTPEVMEDEVLHQPRKNDQRDREQPQPQPQPQPPPPPENKGMSSWDYFFSMENVPGPTLAEVDENSVEREEIERKMLEERARRREMEGKSEKPEPVAETVEKVSELPPQPPPPEAAMAPSKVVKRVKQGVPPEGKKKSGGNNVNLVQIFVELDDCFLKASESAHEVSRMLEATRLHYHSNFADKKGNINHSERVMRVITWNRSFRGLANADDGADDFDSEEHETHATVLDKMLAWEKKLYDEVKAGEQMKLEYQKKVASLNKLKKRGSNTEALERMKAAVSHLHTRYIVDMQSMDSTVSEINRLRDEQLYPKLVALVDGICCGVHGLNGEHHQFALSWQQNDKRKQDYSPSENCKKKHQYQVVGELIAWPNVNAFVIPKFPYRLQEHILHSMIDCRIGLLVCFLSAFCSEYSGCCNGFHRMATMWETIRIHHENQSKIVQALRLLDISQAPKETSDHHHERTRQLGGVVQEWYTNFSELMSQQKEYIKALNSWLKLNLIPIDTNWKEKVSSPGRPQNPPIQILLHAWHDYLEKLPDEPAKASINNFAAIIKTIWQYQKEELDFRNRCADSRKDLIRKTRDFENWYNKYMQKRTPPDDMDPDRTHDKDLIAEKQLMVEAAKQKLEEDEEAYQRQCIQVREKSLMSLKSHLPELFRALSDFSLACSDMYSTLRSISRSRNRNEV